MKEEKKYTNEDLKIMQSWSLERKIQVTQTRIIEWYEHFNGDVYVSFSGGKDSTVLLDLVRRIYPEVPAVFIDTGLEYPEIRDFVKTTDNVIWLKPEMNFKKVIETYGYPLISKEVAQKIYDYRKHPDGYAAARFDDNSDYVKKYGSAYSMSRWIWLRDSDIPISNKCCDVMKKAPAKKYEKETNRKPIVGYMASESRARKTNWLKHGCNVFSKRREVSQPMAFWTDQDVLLYIQKFDLPYSEAYGGIYEDDDGKLKTTKCSRTGCVFCGFGCQMEKEPNRFQMLKKTHPKLWEYCMKPWDKGGLGMKEVLDFIHVKID